MDFWTVFPGLDAADFGAISMQEKMSPEFKKEKKKKKKEKKERTRQQGSSWATVVPEGGVDVTHGPVAVVVRAKAVVRCHQSCHRHIGYNTRGHEN